MTEEKIKNLLQKVDKAAGEVTPVKVNISDIFRRAGRKNMINLVVPLSTAAMLMVALSILVFMFRTTEPTQEQQKIALLEAQVKQLQARTDATLNYIHQVLDEERRQSRLDELEARLASIPDPIEEMQRQVDKTASMLVYQADLLYRELNETDPAIEAYNRVIRLFPDNRWAKIARQRLEEIDNKKSNKTELKGDLKWKLQNA